MTTPSTGDPVHVEFDGAYVDATTIQLPGDGAAQVTIPAAATLTVLVPPAVEGDLITAINVNSLVPGTVALLQDGTAAQLGKTTGGALVWRKVGDAGPIFPSALPALSPIIIKLGVAQ